MSPQESTALTEFARTCKAAVRAVSLYPETHPAIQTSLSRVSSAVGRLTSGDDLALTVLPDALVIDGRTPTRPDSSIGELAALLHARLVATLRVEHAASPQDWHALLLLLGRAPEELIAEGGIAKAWAAGGHDHIEIQEIDYAEVLRERSGGERAGWDDIIAGLMQGDTPDEDALASLLETFLDPAQLTDFLDRFQQAPSTTGVPMRERAAALLRLLEQVVKAGESHAPGDAERVLQSMADRTAQLTPDTLLAMIEEARSGGAAHQNTMAGVVNRIGDATVASLVADSVLADGGASERIAMAFQALVPDPDNYERILNLARAEAAADPRAEGLSFEQLWQNAAEMLTSYSDQTYVSGDYGHQLSTALSQAVEVERVSDDPPERLRAWLSTVSDAAILQLDLDLLLDLLRIEADAAQWETVAAIAVKEIERRASLGDITTAAQLADAIAGRATDENSVDLRTAAESVMAALAEGTLPQHMAACLRDVAEGTVVSVVGRLSLAIGPQVVRPLVEALVGEEGSRTVRRLRELLLSFDGSGLSAVEPLRRSSNPAARRLAIDMLRATGGEDVLPELTSLLEDADPTVQLEAIRALVNVGSRDAVTPLERLVSGTDASAPAVQQLISLKDPKAAPLLAYTLTHSTPRGRWADVHAQVIEALGGLGSQPASIHALRHALYSGEWWAPRRTATIRQAAATALRRGPTYLTILVAVILSPSVGNLSSDFRIES